MLIALLTGAMALNPILAFAQDSGLGGFGTDIPANLNSSIIQQLLGRSSQMSGGQEVPNLPPQNQVFGANRGNRRPPPLSDIERSFSERAGVELRQFGYDAFGQGRQVVARQAGGASDNYLLGVGDELVVNFRGQKQGTFRVRVDREGRVVVPGLPPVTAAGRTLGDFRNDIDAVVANTYVGTEIFVSLGQVRQISVLVLGEVNTPGAVALSALSTAVDAVLLAGGIKRTGTLRELHIYRGKQDIPVDLYALLTTQGGNVSLSIQDGDRILVPAIHDVVAAVGQVRRPGIYELPPGRRGISAEALLDLAGGLPREDLTGGAYRFALEQVTPDGRQHLIELASPAGRIVRGSEILFARARNNVVKGRLQVLGNVRLPGEFPLSRFPTAHALLGRPDVLKPDTYLPYAVRETTDPRTLVRTYESLDLGQVVSGRSAMRLTSDDRIFVFSMRDIEFLSSATVLNALKGIPPRTARNRPFRRNPAQDSLSAYGAANAPSIDEAQNGSGGFGEQPYSGDAEGNAYSDDNDSYDNGSYDNASGSDSRDQGFYNQDETSPDMSVAGGADLGPWRQDDDRSRPRRGLDSRLGRQAGQRRPLCPGAALLAVRVRNNPDGELATGPVAQAARRMVGIRQRCPEVFDREPDLLTFVILQSVFVAGDARRPGIYPVASPGRARDLLSIAGAPGTQSSVETPNPFATAARDVIESREARVMLAGAVKFPGSRLLSSAPTLGGLLEDRSIFTERPYLLFGVIVRRARETLAPEIIPFSPVQVMTAKTDLPLRDQDVVYVFSEDDMRDIVARITVEQARNAGGPPTIAVQNSDAGSDQINGDASDQTSGNAPAQTPQGPGLLEQRVAGAKATAATGAANPAASALLQGAQDQNPDVLSSAAEPPVANSWSDENPAPRPWERDTRPSGIGPSALKGALPSNQGTGALDEQLDASAQSEPNRVRQFGTVRIPYGLVAPVVTDHLATISGSVNRPGNYPLMPQTPLGGLIAVAGGLRHEADLSAVEVTAVVPVQAEGRSIAERNQFDLRGGNYDRVLVSPNDTVFIRRLFGNQEEGAVALLGEVRHPGHYGLLRGETLLSVVQRAGGLTEIAYPYGAVFTRSSAALAEREALQRAAAEIERSLTTLATNRRQPVEAETLQFLRGTAQNLRTSPVLGRISVETNPSVLAIHPELDTLMQPGDAIYYPQRPSTVLVTGEVLNQGSQQFISGQSARKYLRNAGGTTKTADDGRTFLLLPNGTAQPLHLAAWDFRDDKIPPGSAIIVPRDLRPIDWLDLTTNITQVLSQVGVTAASLAVISTR